MKIHIGDTVFVAAGKDRGKKGNVMRLSAKTNKIVVEKVNIRTKHIKKRPGAPGQRIQYEAPIDASNVLVICPNCSKTTRVGYAFATPAQGRTVKQRVCKKCFQVLDKPIERRKTKKKL